MSDWPSLSYLLVQLLGDLNGSLGLENRASRLHLVHVLIQGPVDVLHVEGVFPHLVQVPELLLAVQPVICSRAQSEE
jgi:hypothetical protein